MAWNEGLLYNLTPFSLRSTLLLLLAAISHGLRHTAATQPAAGAEPGDDGAAGGSQGRCNAYAFSCQLTGRASARRCGTAAKRCGRCRRRLPPRRRRPASRRSCRRRRSWRNGSAPARPPWTLPWTPHALPCALSLTGRSAHACLWLGLEAVSAGMCGPVWSCRHCAGCCITGALFFTRRPATSFPSAMLCPMCSAQASVLGQPHSILFSIEACAAARHATILPAWGCQAARAEEEQELRRQRERLRARQDIQAHLQQRGALQGAAQACRATRPAPTACSMLAMRRMAYGKPGCLWRMLMGNA